MADNKYAGHKRLVEYLHAHLKRQRPSNVFFSEFRYPEQESELKDIFPNFRVDQELRGEVDLLELRVERGYRRSPAVDAYEVKNGNGELPQERLAHAYDQLTRFSEYLRGPSVVRRHFVFKVKENGGYNLVIAQLYRVGREIRVREESRFNPLPSYFASVE